MIIKSINIITTEDLYHFGLFEFKSHYDVGNKNMMS
jgi:hypothetical protein